MCFVVVVVYGLCASEQVLISNRGQGGRAFQEFSEFSRLHQRRNSVTIRFKNFNPPGLKPIFLLFAEQIWCRASLLNKIGAAVSCLTYHPKSEAPFSQIDTSIR